MNPYLFQVPGYLSGILKTPAARSIINPIMATTGAQELSTFMDDDRLSDIQKMEADQFGLGDINFSDTESYIGSQMIPGNQPLGFVDAGRNFSMFDQARMGDAVSGTNVQGRDLEADLGMRINPDIQPSQNMFQRAKGAMQDGLGSMRDFAGKGIDLGKMAMSGIGNAIMPGLGFVGNLLSGIDKFDTLSPEDQSFILEQAGGNRPSKDPFGINIRSARGNYADYVRNKGIYAKGKRGDYYRNLQQQMNDRKAKAAEQLRAEQARIEAAYRSQAGQYGGENRQQEREDAGPGYSGSGTAAEMGSFRDGGLASMFVRRG